MNDSKNTVEYRATLDASGVKTGAQEAAKAIAAIHGQPVADSLKDVAGEATRMGAAVKAASGQASDGLERVAKTSQETKDGQAQANQAAQQFLATLREQISVAGKSSEELLRYRAAQAGVAAEAAPLILQWQNQKAAQLAAAEAAQQEAAAQREASIVKQRAAAAQESFLAGLRDQATLQGKTSTEVLQYRAAQLGVSESAAQYIKAIDDANNANKRGTISAGQHAQAMRMLPMQMTDVVTSVASGMPIWMVAIQQGGQIKDSFGGIGNAARAVVGTITPVTAAIGTLVGVGGLMAAAYYQGSAEVSGFTRALAMSGNAAGTNVTEMTAMARAAGDVIGSQHEAAAALTAMAGSGAVARENLQQFTVVATDLERYVGQPVKTTVEHLAKLGEAPVKASIQLNEQYHYLTESVYRQIKALEDQGRKEEAAALAQKTYTGAMAERTALVKGQLGSLERAWDTLSLAARKAWDAMLNVGRAATLDDIRSKIDTTNRELNDLLSGNGFASNGGGAAFGAGARNQAARIEQLKKQLGDLNAQAAPLEAADAQAQIKAEQQANEDAKIAARQRTDALRKEVRSRAEIRKQEIEQLNRDRETLGMGQQEYDKLLAGINEKHKDPKQPKGASGVSVSDSHLATLRSQLQAAQQYHQQLVATGIGATELNTAERESLKIAEQIKLATNAKAIAKLKEAQATADALGVQLRSNDGLEKSLKAHQALIDGNYKDAQATAQRAREQQAANEVFGKGRTAIQQMTLATLQHQLAEAEGSDSFDPKYIASLREKIAAQKDMVAALGQADYKTAKQHADELLRSANELAESYEVEYKFSGLSAAERQRIAAMRQVELKYAKEIAAVDKLNLGDAEKKSALATIEQARLQELAAASNKVMLQQWSESVQQYDDVFRKGFADMLNRGEGKWKSFTTSLSTTFKTTVADQLYKAFAQPIVVRVVGQLLGVSGGGAMATAAQAGGLGSNTGGVNSILNGGMNGSLMDWSTWGSKGSGWLMGQGMDLVTKGWETAGSSLMSLGQTVQGVDTWLKDIPGMSGGIGSAAGYLGSLVALSKGQYGTAIGSAIGTAIMPGIGTMVGGFLGGLANGIFGGSVEQTGSGIAGRLGGTVRSYADFEKDGGWFGSDRSWTQYAALAANSQLQATFEVLQTGIGDQAKALGQSSDAVKKYTREIRFSTQGLSGDQVAARLQEEMTAAGNAMAALVLGTDKYTLAGETASATLQRMSTSLTVTNTSLDAMGGKLFEVGLAGANMASKLVANFGSVDAYIAASEAYYKTYYSQAERANNSTAAMTRQLAELGMTLPGTQTEFRALVSSLDLTTEHGRKAYATLVQMAPQFDETAKMLDELAKAAAADLIATYTRAAAVAPGMQIARDAMGSATSQAQTLGGSMSSINKILGDANSGVLTWGGSTATATTQLTAAQKAMLGLSDSSKATVGDLTAAQRAVLGISTVSATATTQLTATQKALLGLSDTSKLTVGDLTATQRAVLGISTVSATATTQLTAAQKALLGLSDTSKLTVGDLSATQRAVLGISTVSATATTQLTAAQKALLGLSDTSKLTVGDLTATQRAVLGISTVSATATTQLTATQKALLGLSDTSKITVGDLTTAQKAVLGIGTVSASSASQLTAAQQAVLGLRSEIFDLQAAASGTVLNIDGLAKALQGVDTRTWTATITSAFELIAKRVRDDLSSIATERSAVREAAISILGPTVMTPAQIRAQIARQSVSLPGQSGIANAQTALAKADALVTQRQNEYATAFANNANKAPGLYSSADALSAKSGDAARALVATYLRFGKVQDGIRGESVPGSLAGLAVYNDTQANMEAKLKNYSMADIKAFAEQLNRLGTGGLSGGLVSTDRYVEQLQKYQAAMAADAANQAKAASLREQAAALASKVTSAEQALAAARTAQTNASNNAQKAQLDYVAALQRYSLDSGKAVSNLSKLREETVAYYQSQAQLAQSMGASASSLRQTVADIRFSQLDTGSQFANLQERYNVAYSMAMATQGEALAGYGSEMNSLLNPLLQKAQEAGLGGAEYAALVKTLLARAESVASRIEKDAPKNYQEESLGLLGQIDSTLAALEAGAKSSDQVMTEAIKAGTDTTRDGLRAVIAALQGRPVPAFALGGDHAGGWRLVGERGPELEATGPARYFTADQTQRMLSGPPAMAGLDIAPLLRELQELRRLVEVLSADRRADGGAIATNTGRIQRLLDRLIEDDIKHITGLSESLLLQITQMIQGGLQVRNKSGEQFIVTQEAV